jgi:hypothetical protein
MWHLWGKREEENDTENLGVLWKIIVKLIVKKCNEMVWSGYIWHRISKSGVLKLRKSRFHKVREISWLAENY